MSDVYQSSNAAANLTKIFEAAANAQKANVDLKKEVMLHQLHQKMDLEKNAAELHQGNVSGIEKKQMNVDWLKSMGDEPNGTGPSGVANSSTPIEIGNSPSVVNPAQPQTPPMSIANPGNTGESPVYQQPPAMTPVSQQPPQQPSVQYQNLGYTPKEAQDLMQERRNNGQSPNVADAAYVQSLNKVKAGTATQGEIDMVHKMNNQTGNVTPVADNSQMTAIQKGLRGIEKAQGLPEGSMWMNPSTGEPEINPIWTKKVEALNTAQANYSVMQPQRDQVTAELFNKALDPSYYRAGAFGDAQKIFQRGERLGSLYNATFSQPGGADSRQIAELAIGYQNMLAGGTGSVTEVMQLLPKTAVGDANKIAEWFSNDPRGANQQKFVERLKSGVEREMATTQQQMDNTRIKRIATFEPWIQRNPEQARDMMMSYGINPEDYAKYQQGGFKEKSAIQGSGNEKMYGGKTVSDARAQGYTGFDTEKNQWVK